MDVPLGKRLGELEVKMKNKFLADVNEVEQRVRKTMQSMDGSGGWKYAFFALVVVFVGSLFGAYVFYERLRKMHML